MTKPGSWSFYFTRYNWAKESTFSRFWASTNNHCNILVYADTPTSTHMDWEVVLHWAPDPNHSLFLGSVQFCHSVVSNSLWTCGLQHTRPPCLSSTPRVYSTSCPLSWWCYPTISSSVIPFSFRLQSFPASGSFPMSQFSASGGKSIGVSASVSVLPMNIQDWFPLRWTGWICLQSKGLSRVFNTTVQKHQFSSAQPSL